MSPPPPAHLGPGDSPLRAVTRFLVELTAWVTVPWALWPRSAAVALGVGLVLVAVPAACNVPGDKRITGVAVPGSTRVLIELVLYAAAAWGLLTLLGGGGGRAGAALVAVAAVVQVPRWRWMLTRRAAST